MMWWQIPVVILSGLLLAYVAMLVVLWRLSRREGQSVSVTDALRLLPDVLGLLRRLVADPRTPPGVRLRLILLIAYLASPIDLIPDFVPILGYADDAIIVAIALRFVVRHAGVEVIAKHWAGTPEGLRIVERLAGL